MTDSLPLTVAAKCQIFKLQNEIVTRQLKLSHELPGKPLAESSMETTCRNNISANKVDTTLSELNNEGQQSRQPLIDINVFSTNNAASIKFRPFTSVSTTLQLSAFEN